jgi:hypothetical protein
MKNLTALTGILALLAACSHEGKSPSSKSDWGTGLNTVERKYNKPASNTFDAAVSALKAYDLTVDRDRHDEMGGDLSGHRGDGKKVMVKVEALDKNNSRASVRVEPGDARLAQMIHEKMADKLGIGTAKSSLFGGNSKDFPYDADFKDGVAAAERAVEALGYTVIGKEVKDDWAQVDARADDSTPVRFKIERTSNHEFPLKVTFTAGHGKTEESQPLITKMHDEYDRQIGGHVK